MSTDASLPRPPRGPRAPYTPTAEEILAECARIREDWSPEERAMRMCNSRYSGTVPLADCVIESAEDQN